MRPKHKIPAIAAALVVVASVTLSACGGGDESGAARAAANVEVKAFTFDPDPIRVAPGDEITWRNADATVHTVTTGRRGRPDGRVDARLRPSDGTVRATFDKPGSYSYFCSLHSGPGMTGKVVVE